MSVYKQQLETEKIKKNDLLQRITELHQIGEDQRRKANAGSAKIEWMEKEIRDMREEELNTCLSLNAEKEAILNQKSRYILELEHSHLELLSKVEMVRT